MRTNSDLTIYNRYVDPATRKDVWVRTQVQGVAWENRKASNKVRSGDIAADQATIYVSMSGRAGYVKPKAWKALVSKTGKFTFQEGDMVVRGLVTDEITSEFTISNLSDKYDDVLKITSVDTLDGGSASLHHWKLGAK